jgi:hypothetical protein
MTQRAHFATVQKFTALSVNLFKEGLEMTVDSPRYLLCSSLLYYILLFHIIYLLVVYLIGDRMPLCLILFNVVMNEICLKMKEKTGDLKALVYADDVMIWGNNMKELEDKVNE